MCAAIGSRTTVGAMRLLFFVVAGVLAVIHLSAEVNFTERGAEGGCSTREVKSELREDERLDTTGTYLVLDAIQCNGTLVSWHSCFFYSTMMTTQEPRSYSYSVRIFRRTNDTYDLLRGSSSNLCTRRDANRIYGCDTESVDPGIPVLEGDVVEVRIKGSCNINSNNDTVCPGHPNLNSSLGGSSMVLYYPGNGEDEYPASDVLNTSNYVPVHININASIVPDSELTSSVSPCALRRVTTASPVLTDQSPSVSPSAPRVTTASPVLTDQSPSVSPSALRVTTASPVLTDQSLSVSLPAPRVTMASPVLTDQPSPTPTSYSALGTVYTRSQATSSTEYQLPLPVNSTQSSSVSSPEFPSPPSTAVTVTGTVAPTPHPPKRGCSTGEVKSELSEDERLDTTGTYLVLDAIQCNGTLVSWHSCFFYSTVKPPVKINKIRFVLKIFRPTGSNYLVIGESIVEMAIFIYYRTIDDNYGCADYTLKGGLPVLEGDIIGVVITESRCGTKDACAGHPNLKSNLSRAFYHNDIGVKSYPVEKVLDPVNHVPVGINVKAFITEAPADTPGTTDSMKPSENEDSIHPSETAGIVTSVVTITILLIFFVLLLYRRKKRRQWMEQERVNHTIDLTWKHNAGATNARFQERSTELTDMADWKYRSPPRQALSGRLSNHSGDAHGGWLVGPRAQYRERYWRNHYNPNIYSSCGPTESDDEMEEALEYEEPVATGDQPHSKLQLSSQVSPHNGTRDSAHSAGAVSVCGGGAVGDDDDDPYWEPASREDELRMQLARLRVVEIPRQNIQIMEHLGRGHFGTVSKGLWCERGKAKEVAVKALLGEASEDERVKFLQEAAIMGQFHHPNVLSILGVITCEEPMGIVTEVMHKGDLLLHLQTLKSKTSGSELPALLLSYSRQVAAGMGYLAGKSFVHRDLAARNILVSTDNVCKIADFGLSRLLQDEDYYTSHGGKVPVKWTAPEAVTHRRYSTASDVWSYGILLYEIWALGCKPYHQWTNSQALQKVLGGYRLSKPVGCPSAIYKLMLQCWNSTPESRPTFFDILLVLQRPDFQLLRWSMEDEGGGEDPQTGSGE